MPYFSWQGIDTQGIWYSGSSFARTDADLYHGLYAQNINLVHYEVQTSGLYSRKVSLPMRGYIFKQLATLLESGVFLPDALLLIAQQMNHRKKYAREILYTVLTDVQAGDSLANAFSQYQNIFGNLTIALVQAAEETGRLAYVLDMISVYWHDYYRVRRQIKSAAMIPGLTVACFVVVVLLVLYWIVPSFIVIFQTSNKPLPVSTAWVVWFSSVLRSVTSTSLIGAAILFFIGFWGLRSFKRLRYYWDCWWLQVPFVRTLIILRTSIGIAQSLSILLHGGVPLVYALHLTGEIVSNAKLKQLWMRVIALVEDGKQLSYALHVTMPHYFSPDFITLIAIGEESECLANLLERASTLMQDRLQSIMLFITQLIQPCCMIVLGCLVAFLIVAIYMPLFDMSNIVASW